MPEILISSGPLAYDERGGNEDSGADHSAGDRVADGSNAGRSTDRVENSIGAAPAPPVIMLPSGAHERRDFDELRERLPARLRTIAIDWPAHGESPPHPGRASASGFADVAEEAVAALAPDGAVVLGNSIGGFAAGRLAIRRPELVKALVIVDGGGFAGRLPHERVFCALMGRPGFLRAIYPAFSALYMRARTDADRRARESAIATTRTTDGAATVAGLWRSFAGPEHDLREGVPRVAAPTLIVWGRRDPVIAPRLGRKAAKAIPGAQLRVLDTGHVPHTSDPDGFAAALVPFIDAALAGTASPGDTAPAPEPAPGRSGAAQP